jgi:pimeloyl-ACP methyl ester carboxylesterase
MTLDVETAERPTVERATALSPPVPAHDLWVTAFDGLRLHARDEGPRASPFRPVLCLPGLTRNARDFADLSAALAHHPRRPRRVLAIDYRGRGLSAYDRNWRNYNLIIETRDCLDLATAAGLERFVVIGTSRGGLLAMIMAALRPAVLAGVVLNDIGPVIEAQGLARIKGYVETMPEPRSWEEAARLVRDVAGQQFTALDEEGWQTFARATFRDIGGRLVRDFDLALLRTLEGIDFEKGLPTLWPQFTALAQMPALVVRGENSDLLSDATVARMAERHKRLECVTVPEVGHAPFLTEPEAFEALTRFLESVD